MKKWVIGVLIAVASFTAMQAAADNIVTLDRDKNSSASLADSREAPAILLLRDKSIFGETFARVENLKNAVQVWSAFNRSLGDTIAILLPEQTLVDQKLDEIKKKHGEPKRSVKLKSDKGPELTALFWGSVCLVADPTKKVVGYGMPVAWLVASNSFGASTGPGDDMVKFLRSEEQTSNSKATTSSQAETVTPLGTALPPFAKPLAVGANTLTVDNPNPLSVVVGLRQGERGANLSVPQQEKKTIDLPNGKYEVYFVYSNEPKALLQGDSVFVDGHVVTIRIVKSPKGNYSIRLIK